MTPAKPKKISAPRSVKRAKAKEKIFDAAMQLLQDYGYDYITVNNICEMAGISTGNFYHYFESKDELMSNFFVVAWEKFVEAEQVDATGDAIADIVAFFTSYSQFCEDQGLEFVRHFYLPTNTSLSMVITPSAEEHFALPSLANCERQIRAAQEAGVLSHKADPIQLADDLCTLEKGCVFEWCVSDGRFRLAELTDRLLTRFLESWRA